MPFHLEFILSAEVRSYSPCQEYILLTKSQALTSVLRANFKNVGPGAKKIEKGEFAIQDAATKMDIDLTSAWETCFTPGQHTEMSMIMNTRGGFTLYDVYCPKCRTANGINTAMYPDREW